MALLGGFLMAATFIIRLNIGPVEKFNTFERRAYCYYIDTLFLIGGCILFYELGIKAGL